MRVVEYVLRDKEDANAAPEVYRLITTILDYNLASAKELAELYPQRWEVELSVNETKAVLRNGTVTLRSKMTDMVEQEFWGLLLAHYAARKMTAKAASDQHIDPHKLSYKGCIEIIKFQIAGSNLLFPPQEETRDRSTDVY